MADPAGGFYSSQDADSEGEEGKFFLWTPDEIREVLGDNAQATYGVTRHGNFEGKNILEFVGDMGKRPALAHARRRLFEARRKGIHSSRDERVLTSISFSLAVYAASLAYHEETGDRSPASPGLRLNGTDATSH